MSASNGNYSEEQAEKTDRKRRGRGWRRSCGRSGSRVRNIYLDGIGYWTLVPCFVDCLHRDDALLVRVEHGQIYIDSLGSSSCDWGQVCGHQVCLCDPPVPLVILEILRQVTDGGGDFEHILGSSV